MQIEIAVIGKELIAVFGPFESLLILLSLDSLIILIDRTIFKLHFSSDLLVAYYLEGVF